MNSVTRKLGSAKAAEVEVGLKAHATPDNAGPAGFSRDPKGRGGAVLLMLGLKTLPSRNMPEGRPARRLRLADPPPFFSARGSLQQCAGLALSAWLVGLIVVWALEFVFVKL